METQTEQERTHKCLSNMQEHKLKDCPSLQGFKLNWTNKENALKEIKKQEIFKELNIKEYD